MKVEVVLRQEDPPRLHPMRFLLASFLVAIGLVAGTWAYSVLKNLWADYQDSPTWIYLLIGLPLLAFSVAALVGAVAALRRG